MESSAESAAKGDFVLALERAKEAGRKERALCKFKDANGLGDSISMDLTFCVAFNLAQCYEQNKMYAEALNTYSLLVKNKQYANAGRLRVNIGNVYFAQKQYPLAIKNYRMALDQIAATSKELRVRIQRNIGNAHVKIGAYQDAIAAFEAIMDVQPEFQAGFNLVVCYFALGNVDYIKSAFQKLLQVALPIADDEEDFDDDHSDDRDFANTSGSAGSGLKLGPTRDSLRDELQSRQTSALNYVISAAKLIAPHLDPNDWLIGYDWVIEQLRVDHSSAASELQICKALEFLNHKQFDKAIEELKAFEKKDVHLKARAATNLSFLYFLENDLQQASKFAHLAVRHDRYNAKALVNMGNCLLENNDEADRAKELYLEAIGVEADCVEAIYNLGLVNRKLGVLTEALQAFEKLHSLVPSSPEVLYQMASLHEQLGNYKCEFNTVTSALWRWWMHRTHALTPINCISLIVVINVTPSNCPSRTAVAAKYLSILVTKVPSDAAALAHLGGMFAKDDDETQAFHYHAESYRYMPVNLEVISWLGVWFVKSEMYEKAIEFFERAAEIQPNEVKWKLMVASCHRRMQSLTLALEMYEEIHAAHPDNLECLRYLIALRRETNRRYDHYEAKLAKLERADMGTRTGRGQLTRAAAPATASSGSRAGGGGGGGQPHDEYGASGAADDGAYDGFDYGLPGGAVGRVAVRGADVDGGIGAGLIDYMAGNDADEGGAGAGAAESPSRGFGSAADRFSAPSGAATMGVAGATASPAGGAGGGAAKAKEVDDFADADVADLLSE